MKGLKMIKIMRTVALISFCSTCLLFQSRIAFAKDGLPSSPLWVLLSDNAEPINLPRIRTGCTYTYDKHPTNPADVRPGTKNFGRRLLDGDRPYDDWHARVGINWTDLTVTFDLKRSYPIAEVAVKLSPKPPPAYIEVSTTDSKGGQWRVLGKIEPDPERPGWYCLPLSRTSSALPKGRFVRLFCKLHKWGFYIAEVRIYGLPADEPMGTVHLPKQKRTDELVLVRNGEPMATIVIASNAPVKVASAARELQDYLRRVTGATLPLRMDKGQLEGNLLLVGRSRLTEKLGIKIPSGYWLDLANDPPTPEGFVIRTVDHAIVIAGNDDGGFDGTSCAVYAFLEHLGVRWYAPDPLYEVVPALKTIAVSLNREERPAFVYRSLGGYTKTREQRVAYERWRRRMRCGGIRGGMSHIYFRLFPPKEYAKEHTDYYAMVKGKRNWKDEWQVCTTHPDVIRIAAEKSLKWLNEDRRRIFFSLSPNDSGGYCECDRCNQLGELHEPGAAAMRIIYFANEVIKHVRKKRSDSYACFYAYWYTFTPPEKWLPRIRYPVHAEQGVIIVFINEGCHVHRLDDPHCPRNQGWLKAFKRWQAIVAPQGRQNPSGHLPLFIYDWLIPDFYNKAWLKLPWQSPEWAVANLNLWQKEGVIGVNYEAQSTLTAPNRWLMYYAIARRLWDKGASAKAIRQEVCRRLFGEAAEMMIRYFERLERAVAGCKEHARIWHLPDQKELFTPKVATECRKILEEALANSRKEIVRQRIQREEQRFDEAMNYSLKNKQR